MCIRDRRESEGGDRETETESDRDLFIPNLTNLKNETYCIFGKTKLSQENK